MWNGRVVGTRVAALFLMLAFVMAAVGVVLLSPAPATDSGKGISSPSVAPSTASGTVIFGSVGDFDNKAPNYPDMVAEAKRLATRGGMFLLAVGDLGYNADEETWCKVIKASFNNTEVVAGNHDTTQSGPGDINNDVIYCPFNLGVTLTPGPNYGYGISFYFDYPATNPLVRVIMITAGISSTQTSGENYNPGGAEYTWTLNAVTSAKDAGIPWVVVGVHKLCINAGSYGCEIGQSLWDAMIDAGVDLLLTGHYHVYERSYQLAHSASCTSVKDGSYNAACVSNFGPNYTKGDGIVQVTDGAGGRDVYAIDTSNDGQYFPAYMGSNMNSQGKSIGHGTTIFTMNATTLTATTNFCPLGSGDPTTGECPSKVGTTFSDSFTISSNGSPPPPPPPPPLTTDFTFSPANPVTGQTVSFTGTASGGTPPYGYAWAFGDSSSGTGASVSHAYTNPGTYTVNLTVTDSNSSTAKASHQVLVSPPLTASFTFSPSNPVAGQAVNFTASVSGGTPPYSDAWAFGDGRSGSGATVSHTYTAAGSYRVNLTVTDASAATASASKTIVVASPPPPPLSASFAFSPSNPLVGQAVNFSGSASGGTPPYAYAWAFGDGSTASGASASHAYAQPNNYTVVLTVTDAGSQTATATKVVPVTAPPPPPPPGSPTASYSYTPAWPVVGAAVAFDASASSDPADRPLQFRWDWTNDGTFDTSWSTDPTATHTYSAAGTVVTRLQVRNDVNQLDNATHSLPVDGAAPVTTVSISGTAGNGGWYRSTATATLTATDDVSGVATTWARSDGGSWVQATTVAFSSDGVHTLDFYSIDHAGQTESTHTILVSVDRTSPVTTASLSGTQAANGSYVDSVNVTLTATDATSGLNSTSYRIDGAGWQTYASTFAVTGSGAHRVRFASSDRAGNAEATKSIDFTIVGSSPPPPGQPPATSLTLAGQTGADSWYTSAVIVTLSATSPSSASVTIAYRLDGGTWQVYANPFSVNDGVHSLDYNATDEFGNAEATNTAAIKVDTTPPRTSATLTGKTGRDHWYVMPVSVALTASDATSGVGWTRYRLDGGAWQNYSARVLIGNGRHVLDFRSSDLAGLTETIGSMGIKVDGTAPRIAAPASGGIETTGSFAFSWTTWDDVAGVVENDVSVDGLPFVSLGLNTTTSLTLADGDHTIAIRAMDDASNVAWANVTLRVDTNLFSPTGPLQGMPSYVMILMIVGILIFLIVHRHAQKERARRQRARARMRARSG